MTQEYTNEELIEELENVMEKVGHYPSREEVRKFGSISAHTIQTRLGPSWTKVKEHLGWVRVENRPTPKLPSNVDIGWLCGIIDGEGCFRLQKPAPLSCNGKSHSFAPVFGMSFRSDDKQMLDELCRITAASIGYHTDNRGRPSDVANAKPATKLWIRDLPTLKFFLIPIIEIGKLRSKKRYEFEVFKFACNILWEKRAIRRVKAYTDEERILLQSCHDALHEMKAYMSDKQAILEKYELDKYVTLPS